MKFNAIVLAGERPGGSPLAQAAGVAANVLVPVGGEPCLARVLAALRASPAIASILVCGPAEHVVRQSAPLQGLLKGEGVRWMAPQAGPSASALAGLSETRIPALLTSGDHALLTADIVTDFCARAAKVNADFVIGLVPYELVAARYGGSKRTMLRFRDGTYCTSNLFAIPSSRGAAALSLWRGFEADRKHPLRMARKLGLRALFNYLSGRAKVAYLMQVLSARAGCRIAHLEITVPRAAIDVDSVDDWQLAEKIVHEG